jgi:uncharacterized protein (TIGR00297 family)
MAELTVDAIGIRLAIGFVLSASIGALAHRRRSLSASGVLGAILTGTLIFGFGGFVAGLLLIAFFVSSSLLSHFKQRDARKQRAAEAFEKGGRRDLGQALANGGAATLLALASGLALVQPDARSGTVLYVAMVGALAAANADTWATELGVLSKSAPRLITHPARQVPPGTSGGVTWTGIAAAAAGASFIALLYVVLTYLAVAVAGLASGLREDGGRAWVFVVPVLVGGVAGSLFDSYLGATVQAMYYSERRQKETEKPRERDGTPNRVLRGWQWLNNDWVNFISTLFGAGVAATLATVMGW